MLCEECGVIYTERSPCFFCSGIQVNCQFGVPYWIKLEMTPGGGLKLVTMNEKEALEYHHKKVLESL